MTPDAAADVVRWVREGEQLFGRALQILQGAERLAQENWRLQAELTVTREELARLRMERVEAAESLKAIAEQVTRLATAALERLARPIT
jgi:predicted nuclease with TOPRIM domain